MKSAPNPANAEGNGRLQGTALIASLAQRMPGVPGVYQMLGKGEEVLYVGKANNLRKRVSSYAGIARHGNRIARMISRVRDVRYTITRSETDALLLEASLIKKQRPKFNVLLQDSKSFPYILLKRDHPAPQILKHRGARERPGGRGVAAKPPRGAAPPYKNDDYFGPFASVRAVNQTLRLLQGAFLLRSCSDSVYAARERPCLLYQIKRCSAPCVGKISLHEYAALVREAEAFLRGRSRRLPEELSARMQQASRRLDYENASVYRDRLAALTRIQSRQRIHPRHVADADVFAACENAGRVCILAFFFRAGQNWGSREYFPRHGAEQGASEVLDAFLAQFYDDHEPPALILIDRVVAGGELLARALSLRCSRAVAVVVPRRGEKRELVAQAAENAREALGRHLARFADRRALLERLGAVFGLPSAPRRIEVYDNSHIQGSAPVGAMIVAGEEGFMKKEYRKFSLFTADKGAASNSVRAPRQKRDDCAMMREMLRRRLLRLPKSASGNGGAEAATQGFPQRPDLLLLDGGAGQLSVAAELLSELGVTDCALVAIAKGKERNAGRERFFLPGRAPLQLDAQDPLLYYLQSLRDEAHRFAIGFHRGKRSRALRDSVLDGIPGIGRQRKRALLHHFGSQKMVSSASYEDLAQVAGISASLARSIYAWFRENP